MKEKVKVVKLENGKEYELPAYATSGSAGLDLVAAITDNITIAPGEVALISTGIAIALTKGLEAQIRPRSGLALKHHVTVINSPGTIDSDYRGEIKVMLINLGKSDFVVEPGMRIAQMIIAEYKQISWDEVTNLDETDRGSGGFGSTGTHH